MKIFTRILLPAAVLFLSLFSITQVSAQCGGGNNNSTVGFACNSESTLNPQNTGDYRLFTVEQNISYNFNTNGTGFDCRIYGKQGGSGGTTKFNQELDNLSGGNENIDWIADFTGTFGVATHFFNCGWNGSSAILRYKQNTTINNTTSTATICIGTNKSLTYTLGGAHNNPSPSWAIVAGTGTGNFSGNTFTPTGAGSVTIRGTLGVCTSDVTFTINQPSTDPTSISLLLGSNPICPGNSVTLQRSGGSLGTGATWEWYSGSCGGTPVGSGNTISVTPSSTTTYFVRAQGTCNNTNCASITISVNSSSTAPTSATASPSTVCGSNTSTNLQVFGGSLGTGAAWNWYTSSCGGTFVASGQSINVNPTSPTTYFVRAQGGCNTTTCTSVDVTGQSNSTTPTASAVDPTICAGGSTTLNVTAGSLGTGASWKWYTGSCGGSFLGTGPSIGVTPGSTTTYFVRGEGTCNNTSCAQVTVTVRPIPTASISGTTTVCQGGGAPSITFTNPQALPVTVSYNIDGGGTQTIGVNANSTATVSASTATAGTFTYNLVSVQYQTTPNCSNPISGSAAVTVRPTPAATISGTTTVCQDATSPNITFTNSVALPVTVTYQLNSGSNQTINVPASSTATIAVPTSTPGTFAYSLVSVAYTTTPVCQVPLSGSATVTVRPTPAATISGTTAVCQGGTAPTITITNPNTLPETVTYTLNGNPVNININGNSSATVTAPTGTVGTFTYALSSVVYQSAPTCATSLNGAAIVTVNPLPVLQETHTNLSCLNSNDGVINLSVTPPGTTAPYIYSITGGSSFQSANNGTFTGLSAGTYNTLVVQDANGCRNTNVVSVTLTQPTQLNITLSSSTDASCNGVFDGALTVAGSGGTPTYQYSLNGGPFQPGGAFTNLAAGSYTVTVKDAEDCTNSLAVTINNSYTVTAVISNPVNVSCPGLQDGGYTISASGGVSPYNYANNGLLFGTNNVFTGLPIGTYTGFVRDSRGCLASDQVTITTLAAPTAVITGTASFCAGGNTQLFATSSTPGAGGFQGFQWQLNGSNIGGATSAVYTVSAAGNYTVVVTNTNNCSTTSAVTTVTVNPLPTITVNPFATAICNGSSIALTASGASTYTWSPATGLSATTGTTVTASPTSTQTYTVTGTDVNGCVNSTTKTVTVNNLPTVSVSPTSPTICNGSSVQLTASGANSYNWSPATGLLSTTGATVTAQPTSTTTYTVTGTDINGCSNTATKTVTVTNNPTVTITSNPNPATICLGQPITLTSNFATGNLWSNGATTQAITVTPSQVGASTFTLFSTQSGCTGSATKTVTVNSVPFANISPQPTVAICAGSSTTLSAITDNGTIFLWSPGGATTQTATFSTAGAKTVTITNSFGCSTTSAATTISVNPLPTVSVSPSAPTICSGAQVQLTASGASTYTWSPATGLLSTSGTSVTAEPTVTNTYTVTGTDLNGCVNTTNVTVSVTNLPSVTISSNPNPAVICLGQSITLTSNFATGNLWSNGATTQSIILTPGSIGNTTYSLTSTQSACPGSASKTVTVNPLPFAVINPSPSASICSGGSVTLSSATDIGTNYLWSPGGATTQTISATAAGSYTVTITNNTTGCSTTSAATSVSVNSAPTVSVTASPVSGTICAPGTVTLTATAGMSSYAWSNGLVGQSITVSTSGTYTVTVTDANGCTNTASKVVTINPLPTVSFSGLDASYCEYDCNGISLTGSPAGGSFTYSGISGFIGSTFIPCIAEAGTYTITYTYTNANGCTSSSSQTTTVHPVPQPTVSALTPTTVCFGDNVILTTEAAASYLWSNGATTQSISLSLVSESGDYNVTATDAFGCSATTSPDVTVTINALPIPTISIVGNQSTTFCAGDNIDLTTGSYSSYSWLPGLQTSQTINVTTGGNYSVSVVDGNGCEGSSTVTAVTVNPNPVPVISGSLTFCTGGSTTLTSSAASTYAWLPNGETSQSVTASASGNYTVDVVDANGCEGSATVTVNETPVNPVITALSSTTFCSGQSVTLYSSSTSGNLWTPSNETTQFITVTTSGTVTLAVSAGSCQGTTNIAVTVNNLPVVSFSGLAAAYCNDAASATLTGSPSGGTFSGPGISGNSFNPASAGNGVHTITYNYSDVNGCSNSSTQNVTVNNLPTVTFSGLASQYCSNNPSVTLVGSPSGGTFTGTGISGNTFSPSVGAGTYTITYTYSNGNGCQSSSSQSVTVNPVPSVSFTGLDSDYCADEPAVNLTGSPVGGSFSGNGVIGSQFFPTVPGAGSYTVTYTLSNSFGCTSSSSQTVTVHSIPTVSFSGFNLPHAYCVDASSVSLTGSPAGGTFSGTGITGNSFDPATAGVGTHVITYTYSDGFGCANSTSQNVTVNPLPTVTATALGSTTVCNDDVTIYSSSGTGNVWAPNGETTQFIIASATGSYSVTVTDGNGCIATSNAVEVTVNPLPLPVISAGGPTTFCQGGNVTLELTDSYTQYLWSTGETSTTITVNESDDYSVTVTDGNGCSNTSAPVTVTVNPLPVTQITPSGPLEICLGSSITLSASFDVSYSYEWYETNDEIIGETNFQLIVNGDVPGDRVYSVRVTDGNGCIYQSEVVEVTVLNNPTPSVSALGATTFCQGGSVTLVATEAVSYLWSPNGENNQIISASASGNYSVTIVDANGCTGTSAPTTVIVNPLPVPVIAANGPLTFCAGDDVTLNTTIPYAQYLWSNGATTSSITVTAAGNYSVAVTNSNGCSATTGPTVITVNPLPTAGISPSGTIGICSGSSVILQGSGATSYLWSPNNETSQNITVNSAGTYFVTVTDANGCSSVSPSTTVVVNNNPVPTVSALGSTTFCQGGNVTLVATAGAQYLWSPNGETNQIISATTSGNYSVTITDGNGCVGSSSPAVVVTVNPLPVVSYSGLAAAYCVDATPVLLTVSPAGGFFTGPITGNTFNPSLAGVGSHVITYQYTNGNGCSNSYSQTVIVNPLPIVSFSGFNVPHEYCVDAASVTLAGLPVGGTFSGPGISGLQFNPATAGAGTHSVTYTYTDGNGCVNSETQNVTVHPLPVVSFTGLDTEYCIDEATATLVPSPAGGTFSGTGISGNTFSPATAGVGTFTITYTYTDANTCTNSTSQTVTVHPLPIVTFTALAPQYCITETSVTLSGSPSGGTFTGTAVTGNIFNPSVAGVGSYTLTYTYTDVNGCTNSATRTAVVVPLPVVSFSGLETAYCVDGAADALTGSPAGGTFSGIGISGNNFVPSTAGVGTHTIIYTYTDAFGCTNNSSQSTTVNPLPVISFTGLGQDYCINETPATLVGNPNTGTFSGTGISGNIFSPAVAGAGVHTVTFTYSDVNGCIRVLTQSVTVYALPVVSITPITDDFCVTETSVTLNGIPAGGTFSGSGVNETTFNPSVAGVGTHTITYFYTDINGCSNSTTTSVTVLALPTISFSGLSSQYCVNAESVTLTSSPVGGTFSGTGITDNTFSPATAGVGTHVIVCNYTDGNGCSNSSSQSTVVTPLPLVSISGLALEYCVDADAVTLTGNPAGGSFTGDGMSGGTFNPADAGLGIHTISYSYTDANSCSATATASVTVNDLPSVSIDNTTLQYCVSETTVALTASPSGGTFSGNGVSGSNFDPSDAGSGTHTVTYDYTDGNGCENSTSVDFEVLPLPVVNFSGLAVQYCEDADAVTLTGNPAGGTFSGDGITDDTFDPGAALVGPIDITYTYTDGNGCTNSETQSTNVYSLPIVQFSGLFSEYCVDADAVELTPLPAGGAFIGPGMNGNIFTPSSAGVGSHTITYAFQNSVGCIGTFEQTTEIHALPVVSFTGLGSIYCLESDSVPLIGTPVGGYFTGPALNDSVFYPFYAGVGQHTITYTYFDNNGCEASYSKLVNVYQLSQPQVTANGPVAFCQGDDVTLTAQPPFVSYLWSNGATTQSISIDTETENYVTVQDVNGCRATSDTIYVTVYPLPVVNLGDDVSLCPGTSLTLDAGAGFADYVWVPGGSTSQTLTIVASNLTAGDYRASVTDANGCFNYDEITLVVFTPEVPVVSANGSPSICDGQTLVLDAGSGFQSYLWSNTANSQLNSVTQSGSYTVTTTDVNGCEATSAPYNVTVIPLPVVTVFANGPTEICQGNYVTLVMPSGYNSYVWNNGATTSSIVVTQEGDYFGSATNNAGCSNITSTISVTVNPQPQPIITPQGPITVCFGESIVLDAGDLGYEEYNWFRNLNPLNINSQFAPVGQSGSYTVEVIDTNGCGEGVISPPVLVTVLPDLVPLISISADQDTLYSTPAQTYQWYFNGVAVNGANLQWFVPQASGNYSVTVTDNYDCEGTSDIIEFSFSGIGMDENAFSFINLFPNPGKGRFTVVAEFNAVTNANIVLTDMLGHSIMPAINLKGVSSLKQDISVEDFANGVYFVSIITDNGQKVIRYIKEQNMKERILNIAGINSSSKGRDTSVSGIIKLHTPNINLN